MGTAAGYQADVVSQEEMEVAMTAAVGQRPCALFVGAQRELHRRSPRSASLSTDSCAAPASSKLRRWRSGTRHTRATRAPSEFARRREAPDTHTLSKRGSGLVLMTREMQRGLPPDHGDQRDGHDCESEVDRSIARGGLTRICLTACSRSSLCGLRSTAGRILEDRW